MEIAFAVRAALALPLLVACAHGSSRGKPSPTPTPMAIPKAEGTANSAAAIEPVATASAESTEPEPAVDTGPPPAHDAAPPAPRPRADGSCDRNNGCAPPATCAHENAIVGKAMRHGSYCTTAKDLCKAWDDLKCGTHAACLYSQSEKRWLCQPAMRGLVD